MTARVGARARVMMRARWTRARAVTRASDDARRDGRMMMTRARRTVVDASSVAALRAWLKTHGARVDESLTMFVTSWTYGIAGVALRDAEEGEVRRARDDAATRISRWISRRILKRARGTDGAAWT